MMSSSELETELVNAIGEKDIERVKLALESGVNPNFICNRNIRYTPLIFACLNSSPDVVRVLLNLERRPHVIPADPNFVNAFGEAPLHRLISGRSVEPLLKASTAVDGTFNYAQCGELFANDPILKNDLEIFRVLVQAGADINQPHSNKLTPVYLAVEALRIDLVLELFKCKADTTTPKGVELPFIVVTLYQVGFKKLSKLLRNNPNLTVEEVWIQFAKLEKVFRKNSGKKTVKNGLMPIKHHVERELETELMNAIGERDVQRVRRVLEKGVNPNFINSSGEAPLHRLICYRSVQPLLEVCTGRDGTFDYAKCGQLYANDAVLKKDVEIFRALVHAGADINKPLPNKKTPIYLAGEFIRLDLVLELFKCNADITKPKGIELPFGWPTLYLVGFQMLKKLLKKNPDLTVEQIWIHIAKLDTLLKTVLNGKATKQDLAQIKLTIKADKLLENYIDALEKTINGYLLKKAKTDAGKAKFAGADVFLKKVKHLDTIDEAEALQLPFSELFTNPMFTEAAQKMVQKLPRYKGKIFHPHCMLTLREVLSLNRLVIRSEPKSLKLFETTLQELKKINLPSQDEDSDEQNSLGKN